MKKITAILLSLLFIMTPMLASCNNDDTNDYKIDGENEWNEIFEDIELTNYTIKTFIDDGENEGKITENAIYYYEDGYEQVYVVKEHDSYTAYAKIIHRGDKRYFEVIGEEAEEAFEYYKAFAAINLSSLANQYEKFTYDENEKAYLCSDTVRIGAAYDIQLNCLDIKVYFENGAIIGFESSVYLDEDPSYVYSFKCFDIGSTAVYVPQEVIDEAKDSSMPS